MKYSEIYGVKKKEASTGEKIKDTTLDVLANLGTGISRSLEGIVDYGMGIVGGIGGIWDKDFQDRIQKNIEHDWTGETLGANRWQEELDDSVLKSGGFTENVLQGIGGMLPSIAVSFIPGVGAGLAMGTMGVGAAGQSMQDALNSGADYNKAFGYGTVSGAIEAATEKIGGFTFGGGSSLTGKILAKTGKGTLLKKGIGKAAETFVSEGAEEVLSDLLDPVNKAVFDIGDQSFSENMGEAVKGLPQTFLVGGTVGTIMQGGNDIIRGVSNNQRGGFNANKADDFIEYKNDLAKNYTADENNNAKFDAETDKAYNEVSAALKKMTPEKRSEYLKSIGAEAMAFDNDGNVVAKRAKSINNEAITGNLRAVSGNLLHAPLDVNTPITEGAKAAKNAVEKASGANARVVVSEMDDGENASFDIKNGIIYFNNNSKNLEEKASAIAIAFHELTHTTEGTEAYNELQRTLSELAFDENVPESIKAKMGDLDTRKLEIINDYNLGVSEKDAYILDTELSADLVGELIGSEYFADKLALRNKPLAEKMFSKIKDLLTGKGDKIDKQTRKYLNKVYKSFAKALDKSVGGVSLSMFDGDDDEKSTDSAKKDENNLRHSLPAGDYDKSITVKDVQNLRTIGRKSVNDFTSEDIKIAQKWANKFYQELGTKSPFFRAWFGEWRAHDDETKVSVVKIPDTATENQRSLDGVVVKDTQQDGKAWRVVISGHGERNTRGHSGEKKKSVAGLTNIKGLVENAILFNTEVHEHHDNNAVNDYIAFDHKLYSLGINENGSVALYRITIEEYYQDWRHPDLKRFHNLKYVEEVSKIQTKKAADNLEGRQDFDESRAVSFDETSATTYSISDLYRFVKTFDKEFSAAPEANPLMLEKYTDENGVKRTRPKVFYHGTNSKFYTFDLSKAGKNFGETSEGLFFFTDKKDSYPNSATDYAEYVSKKNGGEPTVMPVYLSMRNPLVFDARGSYDAVSYFDSNAEKIYEKYFSNEEYDGIVIDSGNELIAMVDNPSQIKSATENIGTFDKGNPDIRYSKSKSDIYKNISSEFNESIKRRTVNESMLKRYTLTDSDKIITEIMGELGFYDGYSEYGVSLKGKSKTEAIRVLTDGLNSKKEGERAGVVEEVADIIIKNAIATQIINESDETAYARTVLKALKPFLHNMNLDYIKGDIEVKYDKDKSVYALWGRGKDSKRSGKPYTADEVAQALEDEGIRVEATNEADIFLEIDQMYRDALAVLKSYIPSKSQFKSILSESEYKKIKNDIKNEILRQADNYGSQTQLAKTIEKYQEKIKNLKEINKEIREKMRIENSILYYAKSIGGMKQGKFANATQVQSAAIEEMRKLVSKLVVRDNINRSSIRKIFGKIKDFYSEFVKDGNPFHEFYMEDMAEVINAFSQVEGNKALSETELEIIRTALAHIDHVFKNYTKVYKNGKLVDGEDIVKQQIEIAEEANKDRSTLVKWLIENKYVTYFNDPSSVMQAFDGYNENGFHSSTLRDFQDGAIKRAAISMDLHSELDAFAKKHKKYIKSLKKDKINVGARLEGEFEGNPRIKNIEVPRGVALSLYMTSKRTQAMKTLDEIGWRFTDKDGKGVRCGTLTAEQVKSLEEGFTDEDKQFIKICEDIYSKCKDIKMEVDFRRLGASNVIDGYYYPIRRYIRDKAEKDFVSELKTVSGLSFNKNTVKGAKIELVISDALSVLENHIDGISRYAGFAEAIDTMDRLYNLDISGNPNLPVSIKSTLDASNRKGYEYLKTLVRDMQGLDNRTDLASKAVSYMRGAFAKFQLGLNPKVLFTQSTSYVAAFGELGANSLLKGIGISGKDVDKYCDLAAIRNYDGSAAKAMAVDTGRGVSKVGDALMKPISMADRFIVERLFGACQYEAYSKYHLDIGTEENKQKAGEILTRVILNTQQNALATEWSAAMRSPSEIARTVTMFSADAMKTISRWFDAIGRTATLKKKLKRLKASGDSAAVAEVEAQIKSAKKKLVKQSAVLIMVSAYASLIAELFHFLYNKDDDDKETVLTHLYENFFGQLVGFFPVIRDIVSAFKDGFEVDNYAYSMINGVISSATNCYKAIEDAVSGKPVDSQTSNRNIRNLVYSLSQFAGIPVRNVYNLTTGLIRRFSESTGYKIDNAFSAQSYQADFNKAISEGNDKLASTILNEWLSNRDVDITDEATKTEIMRLQKLETTKSANDTNSYDVIPSKVPSQISINGESYELTASEQEAFRTAYEEADKAVSKAVKDYRYKRMDDKSKAAVIRSIYNYYYQSERANLGADAPAVVLLGKAISIDKLSIILAYCKTLVGDKNRRQKIERYISSCGLTNAEKYIILGYLGYKNENGKSQVKYYVNKLSLTKDEKQKLMEYGGAA